MSEKMGFKRRAISALMFGLIGLIPLSQRARLQTIHVVDLISLIGCGMCFGVALTLFIFALKSRRT